MAEKVMIRHGKYEVDPARMQDYVKQQKINEEERERIIKSRHLYLEWMHKHFAGRVLPPPANEE